MMPLFLHTEDYPVGTEPTKPAQAKQNNTAVRKANLQLLTLLEGRLTTYKSNSMSEALLAAHQLALQAAASAASHL